MTGLPAILSIGLGVMCVCGRRRVPLPANGMMTFISWFRGLPSWCVRSLASVTVLEPHDVVEVRRRHLENVAIRDCFHLMDGAGRDPKGLADLKLHVHRPIVLPHAVDELSGQQIHRLV